MTPVCYNVRRPVHFRAIEIEAVRRPKCAEPPVSEVIRGKNRATPCEEAVICRRTESNSIVVIAARRD